MKHHLHLTLSLPRLIIGVVVISIITGYSLHHSGHSYAATSYDHSPLGYIDSCQLSGSTTIIKGWAYDPDAAAGSLPNVSVTVSGVTTQTVGSSVSGYRDSDINSYINKHDAGAPTSSIYGWQLSVVNLYKGTTYKVSATIINYGTGSNYTSPVNHSSNLNGGYPFGTDNSIPTTCLTAAPTPVATTTPTKTTTTTTTPKTTTTTKTVAPAAPAAPSASADGTVMSGTSGVSISIPAGNATKVHVLYGAVGSPMVATNDQDVSADPSIVTISDLAAKTDYTYQLVRTNSAGVVATSPAAAFTTNGYDLAVHFINSKKNGIAGISVQLNDVNSTTAKSSTDGIAAFSGLADGNYTMKYKYHNHQYTKKFDTSSNTSAQFESDGTPTVITLSDVINVDKLSSATSQTTNRSSNGNLKLILILLAGLVGIALGGWFILAWWRRRRSTSEYETAPTYNQITPPGTVDAQTLKEYGKHEPAAPLPTHAGESLREMVIESMRSQPAQQSVEPPEPIYTPPVIPAPYTPQPAAAAPLPMNQSLPLPSTPTSPKSSEDSETLHIHH